MLLPEQARALQLHELFLNLMCDFIFISLASGGHGSDGIFTYPDKCAAQFGLFLLSKALCYHQPLQSRWITEMFSRLFFLKRMLGSQYMLCGMYETGDPLFHCQTYTGYSHCLTCFLATGKMWGLYFELLADHKWDFNNCSNIKP